MQRAGQGDGIEKNVLDEKRGVPGIVPTGGAEVSTGGTGKEFELMFKLH